MQEKKANQKKLLKQIKKMQAKVKAAVERKQVIKAVDALKAYQKKV